MARGQYDVNLSQLIALLGAQLCQCPNNVSGALVICCVPLPLASPPSAPVRSASSLQFGPGFYF